MLTCREARYREGDEVEAAEREVKVKHAEAFVNFCGCATRSHDPDIAWQSLTLTAFPQKYTFNTHGVWIRRVGNKTALGRMYPVHPNKGDTFYLRLLLSNIIGSEVRALVQRFGQERAGVNVLRGEHSTFKEACKARGLIADDAEWQCALEEASRTGMPPSIRVLFLHILMHCHPEKPIELFEMFCLHMGDDFRKQLQDERMRSRSFADAVQDTDENVRAITLYMLRSTFDAEADEEMLKRLPSLTVDEERMIELVMPTEDTPLPHVYDYYPPNEAAVFEHMYARCVHIDLQASLIDSVRETHESGAQILLYVDAPGGCGKTYCFNCLLAYFRSVGGHALAVAATGIAALQLVGGKTVHTGLKVPFDPTGTRRGLFPLNVKKNSALGRLICHDLNVIIWDEAPMTHLDIFESVNQTLKDLRSDKRPFGGVSVILGGDFRQCLPVVRNGSRSEQVNASILRSATFADFGHFTLTENLRVRNCITSDPSRSARLLEWADTLLRIGNGHYCCESAADDDFDIIAPPIVQMKGIECLADVDNMLIETFGDLHERSLLQPEELMDINADTAILCPVHVTTDYINARCLTQWTGQIFVKTSADEYADMSEALVVTLEQINVRTPNGSPPHRLELKIGMPLILLRNMSDGLMNGTRLILLNVRQYILSCRVLNGESKGDIVHLPRFVFTHEGPDQPLKWTRRQFPVKPCWAMTINKSQSQTFTSTAVCLVQITDDDNGQIQVDAAEPFTHGQLYVALGRNGDADRTCVYTTAERLRTRALCNVVYPEALHMKHDRTGDLRGSIIDPDDPRAHLLSGENFEDVPYHGYVFEEACETQREQFDGHIDCAESIINFSSRQEDADAFLNAIFAGDDEVVEDLINFGGE